jgi:xanthine dehydrogenase accessory factor
VSTEDVLARAARLQAEGTPCVLATVVAVRRPASARVADRALVSAEGVLEGWVGGACSEPVVVREALRALAESEPRLVRIGPPGTEPLPGGVLAESSCASEGTIDVLVEPRLPPPLLAVVGEGPVARTLLRLAEAIGWRTSRRIDAGADAVVAATMGRGDEEALRAALALGAGYVGLVASARRASVVLTNLRAQGISEAALARVRSPAGLDLGPLPQEEIAVAILAELVAWRRVGREPGAAPVAEALDPVCGMPVAAAPGVERLVHEGTAYWFCSPGCRSRFEAEPARFAAPA